MEKLNRTPLGNFRWFQLIVKEVIYGVKVNSTWTGDTKTEC